MQPQFNSKINNSIPICTKAQRPAWKTEKEVQSLTRSWAEWDPERNEELATSHAEFPTAEVEFSFFLFEGFQ
jgi:hypothetical protein